MCWFGEEDEFCEGYCDAGSHLCVVYIVLPFKWVVCETQSESGAAIWQAVSINILMAGESVNTCAEKCLAYSARKCVFKASGEGR